MTDVEFLLLIALLYGLTHAIVWVISRFGASE